MQGQEIPCVKQAIQQAVSLSGSPGHQFWLLVHSKTLYNIPTPGEPRGERLPNVEMVAEDQVVA